MRGKRSAAVALGLVTVAGISLEMPAKPAYAAWGYKIERTSAGVWETTNGHTYQLWWTWCEDPSAKTEYIFLETDGEVCGGGTGFVSGSASLTTKGPDSYVIEICQHSQPGSFWEPVAPANPDGSMRGDVIWYSDPAGGGCFIAAKYYPIYQFGAGDSFLDISSFWVWPYSE